MAKKYYEMYEEVSRMKPKTQQYYKAVSKMFNLSIDKDKLQIIREFRKNGVYKQGKTLSQAFKEYDDGVKYENMVVQRAYDIWSGEYLERVTNQYANNYLSALEKNGISSDIIEYLRNNMHIIKMGAMPPITDFYVPSKGKGKKYHLNLDNTEEMEESIRDFLRHSWGADL